MKKYENIAYYRNATNDIEIIICKNSSISYPLHNHVSVFTIGIITNGEINFNINNKNQILKTNDIFVVPPYISHSIAPVSPYSAITLCINKSYILNLNFDLKNFKIDFITDKFKQFKYNENLKIGKILINNIENFPENNLSINEMSLKEFTSKYHFIKKFKKTMGITPHKFLI